MPTNAAFETTLGSLARPSGLARLQEHLEAKGEPASLQELVALQQYVQNEVADEAALDNVSLRVTPTYGGGQYFARARRINVTNPTRLAPLAHEVGHAKSLATDLDDPYNQLQQVSRSILKIQKKNEKYVLPLLMTLPLLTRASSMAGKMRPVIQKILGGAAIGSLVAGAPVLYEEAQATANAIDWVPEKTEAIRKLVPSFLDYVRVAGVPALAYYVTKRLV